MATLAQTTKLYICQTCPKRIYMSDSVFRNRERLKRMQQQRAQQQCAQSLQSQMGGPLRSPTGGGDQRLLSQAEQQERLRGQGALQVTVRRATNLVGKDRGGTSSDPYVVLKLGGQEQRTRTIKRNLNPVWEQRLDFRGSLADVLNQSLTVSVMDHDEITRDDSLGSLALPLRSQLEFTNRKDLSLDLPTRGTLYLALEWVPFSAPALAASGLSARGGAPPPPPPPPIQQLLNPGRGATPRLDGSMRSPESARQQLRLDNRGTVRVHVHRGSGLKAADFSLLGKSTSDPYVEATVLGRDAKTRAIKKTLGAPPLRLPAAARDGGSSQTPMTSSSDPPPHPRTHTHTRTRHRQACATHTTPACPTNQQPTTTTDPEWHETLAFGNVVLRDVVRSSLLLRVLDQDNARGRELFSSKDDVLGELTVPLSGLERDDRSDYRLRIPSPGKPQHGQSPAWSASWRGRSWPPRARRTASEGLGLPSALVRRGPAPRISPGGRGLPARGHPSRHSHCV